MKQLWVRVPSHEDYPPASGHRKASPAEVLAAAATLDGAEVDYEKALRLMMPYLVEHEDGWAEGWQGRAVRTAIDAALAGCLVIPLPDKETTDDS